MNSADISHIGERLETLEGVLEKLVFASAASDFMVGRISVRGRREPITIVGSLPTPRLGEVLILQGKWQFDRKFGEQFRFHVAASKAPASIQGIEKYLSSGMIDGIGPEMARRITAKFREKTLDVIESKPESLRKVPGIGPVRAAKISEAFREQKAVREVMLFLQTHGISSAYAAKIFKKFGQNSLKVVTLNPYCLASEIRGIGFKLADKIAGNIGYDLKSPLRAKAGLLYILESNQTEGHVYTPEAELLQSAKELLGIESTTLSNALGDLVAGGQAAIEADRVYTWAMSYMENLVAKRLGELIASPRQLPQIKVDAAVNWIQKRTGMLLSDAQIEAIRAVFDRKALIITGGPGTGKTTLLHSLLEILESKHIRVLLAAPTGRAAKRLSEATKREAKTIHRMLEYSPGSGFQRNKDRILEADIIIIDEASMVDLSLMHNLLGAISSHSGLILVGDAEQLPSVGPGAVLDDLIRSNKIHVVRLNTIFRQAQESLIITNAHLVNQGSLPVNCPEPDKLSDFYLIEKEDPEECVRIIKELTSRRIPERFGFDPMKDVQVLSPMHKGPLGTENLNKELRDLLNPYSPLIKGDRFRIGDKVMQVKNNYDKDVFNGDVGQITNFHDLDNEVTVDFYDRKVAYHISELDELTLAYAVTIHKSQGSEYKAVIIPLSTQHFVLLRRNLVYTAVTRGKNLVVLIGSPRALEIAVQNRIITPRNTYLAHKL